MASADKFAVLSERHGKRKSADTALDESRHGSFRRSPGAGLPAENPDTLSPIFQWPYLDTNFASPKDNTSPATVYHDSCDSAAGNNIWSTPLNYAETIPALRQMSFDGDGIQQYLEACFWKDFGEFLGNTGSDVTPTTTPTSSQDDTSRTSTLHVAVKKGNGRIVRLLLKHGANSNLKDATGLTPLLQATISGHEEIVEILLSHGALVEQADDQSRSVLHWAILSGNQRLLKSSSESIARDEMNGFFGGLEASESANTEGTLFAAASLEENNAKEAAVKTILKEIDWT
ncbi:hypothetical protein M409DRAFT_15822 [Zasmidium cellare ATCC 36951]|uniref:Uncharacterized protein n=1 Tax=Zasmidium cellare ATCC 36951 TaxID=1080233 RepID=A0A6A6D5P6_ZASCE|nr:uncharacterized protein M409DRAFT_15822 [Zasmidium cellare ATCC 36951]KAF2173542.1 hypothetical protein M409DRAFT_15822 [Zasmidium cellare ATCC 36951]